jgi:hypothetical protein
MILSLVAVALTILFLATALLRDDIIPLLAVVGLLASLTVITLVLLWLAGGIQIQLAQTEQAYLLMVGWGKEAL